MPGSHVAWRVPAYLPYLQPPLTALAIEDSERALGLRLPDAYLAALRAQNGGYLRYGVRGFEIARELWGIGPRVPSINEGPLAQRVGDDGGWLPDGASALLPFAGDGHWYMCMDFRDGHTDPAITYVDLELERLEPVAGSFAALTSLLAPRDDDRPIGVTTDVALDDVARRLADVLRMTLRDQGDQLYGYRTFHGRSAGTGAVAQFWVSPNEVPRGFVPKTHREYATLVDRLPGTALRVPEHPDCTLLLTSSEIGVDDLLAACARVDVRARLLDLG